MSARNNIFKLSELYKLKNKFLVKNTGFINFQTFIDPPDGHLYIAEGDFHIPFPILRTFHIINASFETKRGGHALKKCEQVICCFNGSFNLTLDDGKNRQTLIMDDPSIGVYLGKNLWREMTKFVPGCVAHVWASRHFKENDYLRDYKRFLTYLNSLVVK